MIIEERITFQSLLKMIYYVRLHRTGQMNNLQTAIWITMRDLINTHRIRMSLCVWEKCCLEETSRNTEFILLNTAGTDRLRGIEKPYKILYGTTDVGESQVTLPSLSSPQN